MHLHLYTKYSGHVTKIATMPIYGKNRLKNLLLQNQKADDIRIFMFLFCLVFAMSLCASVYMCFVVTCWERADLLALVCGVYCEFVTFPLVSLVRCGT